MKVSNQINLWKRVLLVLGISVAIILIASALLIKNTSESNQINLEPQILKSTLKSGEKAEHILTLTNLRNKEIDAYPILVGIDGKIINRVQLLPLESKRINVETVVPEGEYGTLVGEVEFSADLTKTSSLIVIDSETKTITFDATVEPAITPSDMVSGSTAAFIITIYNLKGLGAEDLFLEYSLISSTGTVVLTESERASTSPKGEWFKATISKTINIPLNAAPGKYVFAIKLSEKGSVSAASTVFEIGKTPAPAVTSICSKNGFACSSLVIIVLLMAFLIGGYAFYTIGLLLLKKARRQETQKRHKIEWIILILIAIVTLFILYQILARTKILSTFLQNSTGTLRTVIILAVIFLVVELLIKKRGNIFHAKRLKTKKMGRLAEIKAERKIEYKLWLEKRKVLEKEKESELKKKLKIQEEKRKYASEMRKKLELEEEERKRKVAESRSKRRRILNLLANIGLYKTKKMKEKEEEDKLRTEKEVVKTKKEEEYRLWLEKRKILEKEKESELKKKLKIQEEKRKYASEMRRKLELEEEERKRKAAKARQRKIKILKFLENIGLFPKKEKLENLKIKKIEEVRKMSEKNIIDTENEFKELASAKPKGVPRAARILEGKMKTLQKYMQKSERERLKNRKKKNK